MWLPPECRFTISLSADADADNSNPDNVNLMYASTASNWYGKLGFTSDGRNGHINHGLADNVIVENRWFHIAMQKDPGASTVRVYVDGVLRITADVEYPMSNIDVVKLAPTGTGVPFIREFNIRSVAPYPTAPFTPGGAVLFASAMGDLEYRWNSYMLG
jgi:hypothetical protein